MTQTTAAPAEVIAACERRQLVDLPANPDEVITLRRDVAGRAVGQLVITPLVTENGEPVEAISSTAGDSLQRMTICRDGYITKAFPTAEELATDPLLPDTLHFQPLPVEHFCGMHAQPTQVIMREHADHYIVDPQF